MASALRPQPVDPFAKFLGMPFVLDKILKELDPNDVVCLAAASPVMKQYVTGLGYIDLDFSVQFARQSHEEPRPGQLRPVDCYTTAALRFTTSDEDGIFGKMLEILDRYNGIPEWLTFGVVIASCYDEALRAKVVIEEAGIYTKLCHGFPAPATRSRIFYRTGLAILLLYRLGGELDRLPDLMITLHPPSDGDTYLRQLSIGAKDVYNICTLEEGTSLAVCQLRNTMNRFNWLSNVQPRRTILPAGLTLNLFIICFKKLVLCCGSPVMLYITSFTTYLLSYFCKIV